MKRLMGWAVLLALGSSGCLAPSQLAASAKHSGPAPTCSYDAELVDADKFIVEVDAHCRGAELRGFAATEAPVARFVDAAAETELERRGQRWQLLETSPEVRFRYRVRLGDMAARTADFDLATRQGDALVAPGYSWLLRPDPLPSGTPIRLTVKTPPGSRFTTGLQRRSDGSYSLLAQEIRVATYGVFGEFDSETLQLPPPITEPRLVDEAILDIAFVGPKPAAGREDVVRWIDESARAVSRFWHGFPVARAQIVLINVPDSDRIVYGKVLPASAPGVVLLVGEHADTSQLYDDWVLVHELFHLGFPSFSKEGKWLDEGLATYYEPLIRARASWKSEEEVWEELAYELWRGMPAAQGDGLEHARSFRGIYWGGALVCLMADVETRRRSGGAMGLEDGLRELLRRGGNASQVWSLEQAVEVIDDHLGGDTLGRLTERHAYKGSRVPLSKLLQQLGVQRYKHRSQGVRFDDDAPLAAIRRALLLPTEPPELEH